MAQTYTTEQALQAARDSGYNYSSADLAMAQYAPDALMTIVNAKKGWYSATTPEEKAKWNKMAEDARSSWGNYTGGTDGSKFYVNQLSPQSFSYGAAPEYTPNSLYSEGVDNAYNAMLNYGQYSYGGAEPTWSSRYDDTKQDLLAKILNNPEFSYDPATDQLYSAYRKQYNREGQRAQAEALAQAAAASGGQVSSYAATAAAQAGNYYGAQLTDKIPELYQLAYNKYLNDYNMKLTNLDAVQGQENSDYTKFLNQLQQYNTNREFDYNAWRDYYNMLGNNVQVGQSLDAQDYERYRDQLAQYNTDRNFYYGQLLDEINSQANERAEALNKAELAANYYDYSLLNNEGINTAMQEALLRAEFGDYSGLNALGINTGEETSGGYTGSENSRGKGYDTHGYTPEQIKQIQRAAHITVDGKWGPQTQAAYDAGYRPDTTPTQTTPPPTSNNAVPDSAVRQDVMSEAIATINGLKRQNASASRILNEIAMMQKKKLITGAEAARLQSMNLF